MSDQEPAKLNEEDLGSVIGGSVDPASVARAAGVNTANFSNMNLDTIMMMVNMDRANMLDAQVRSQAASIKANNDILVQANSIYAQMKQAESMVAQDKKPSADMIKAIDEFCDAQGIKQAAGDLKDHSRQDWDINLTYMKSFIDNRTSTSQLEMIQLQSIMNKFNQTTEGLSNWLSKDSQSKNTIVGNLR